MKTKQLGLVSTGLIAAAVIITSFGFLFSSMQPSATQPLLVLPTAGAAKESPVVTEATRNTMQRLLPELNPLRHPPSQVPDAVNLEMLGFRGTTATP
ncbi:MAG: hypothetical protein HQL91_06595 [Magnetococcales bacterium]|nr:hypothetical protein [Magnetococcales bacterium]